MSEHILDAHRIYWKQDLLHGGKASQTRPRGRVRQGDTFFGLSKPDIPGDKLGFGPLSVRPCPHRAEPKHHLQIHQRDKWLSKHQLYSDLHFQQAWAVGHLLYTLLQDFHLPCSGSNVNSPGNTLVHVLMLILPETFCPCPSHQPLLDFRGLMGFIRKYSHVRRPCYLIFPKEFLGSSPTHVHM